MASELVERAQRGDHEAFDALATAAYNRLYAIARRILRDGYAAEDAVQETLVRAWRELRSLRDPERFDAWLHRPPRQRLQGRGPAPPASAVRGPRARHRPAVGRGPARASSSTATSWSAPSCRLTVEQRAALVLTHYVGLSAGEVGGILGIPVGTVYSRLHYGARAMRDAIVGDARTAGGEPGGRAMSDAPDRILVDWLIDGPDQPPRHGLERALAATRRTNQRPRWTYPRTWFTTTGRGSTVPRLAVMTVVVLVVVTAALGFVAREGLVGSPFAPRSVVPFVSPSPSSSPSPSPSPSPTATPAGDAASRLWLRSSGLADQPAARPRNPTSRPVGLGAPVRPDRAAVQHPPVGDRRRPGARPHAPAPRRPTVRRHARRSQHVLHDPVDAQLPEARRGPGRARAARIVDGNLVLGFALVPYDPACEGTSSTYSLSPDGWTLTGIDVPFCSFQGFVRH